MRTPSNRKASSLSRCHNGLLRVLSWASAFLRWSTRASSGTRRTLGCGPGTMRLRGSSGGPLLRGAWKFRTSLRRDPRTDSAKPVASARGLGGRSTSSRPNTTKRFGKWGTSAVRVPRTRGGHSISPIAAEPSPFTMALASCGLAMLPHRLDDAATLVAIRVGLLRSCAVPLTAEPLCSLRHC